MLTFLRREPGFYKRMWRLALPLLLQNLITTSLAFVDTFMVGLLGNSELSAVTAANAPIFMIQVVVFGLISGLTVLVSQFWGKQDFTSINRTMGVALYAGFSITALIALVLFCAPFFVMGLVTDNPQLIEIGAPYLRIVGISYVFNAVSSVYVGMQRSTENPAMGMVIFGISMLLNTFLNYCLIFGKFGAPALGVTGAAIATLISRVVEFLIVLSYSLLSRRVPLEPRALFRPGTAILRSFISYSSPVILNESLWGLGTTVFTAIMGHMTISTEMLAAYAVIGNLDKVSTVTCFGVAGASAIIVGKLIGEGADRDHVYSVGCCLLAVSLGVGVVIALVLLLLLPTVLIPHIFPLFHLEGLSMQIAITMCGTYILTMPLKSFDINSITGVLRAGGDVRMSSFIDLSALWLIAIPLTALTGLVLEAPVLVVCLAIQTETMVKMPCGLMRIRSRRWINDVTREVRI